MTSQAIANLEGKMNFEHIRVEDKDSAPEYFTEAAKSEVDGKIISSGHSRKTYDIVTHVSQGG
ncbi:hypothetical protein CO666_13885 [Rhizobium chutanense]|uniref:Uncharacterized protein n=1 Tax=Rhizobium chutanense TaxID=2035448 RepID=A0A2A6JBX3_9HYPH|nr:hypothetical protein [Rhizobium chutanense]PDT03656.1 hypothetical protein CO666_13885 [Rhizobium chutanense]